MKKRKDLTKNNPQTKDDISLPSYESLNKFIEALDELECAIKKQIMVLEEIACLFRSKKQTL
jgi:hypothetical protein